MKKADWMVPCILGSLLPAAAFADDAGTSGTDAPPPPVTATTPETFPLESLYSSRWKLSHPVETMTYSDATSAPIAGFAFQEPGAFARVSKVRELSLLTLAEVGSTRLFLGVSDKGLLGIHLGALPRFGDERSLELVRMPYLENFRHDNTAE